MGRLNALYNVCAFQLGAYFFAHKRATTITACHILNTQNLAHVCVQIQQGDTDAMFILNEIGHLRPIDQGHAILRHGVF